MKLKYIGYLTVFGLGLLTSNLYAAASPTSTSAKSNASTSAEILGGDDKSTQDQRRLIKDAVVHVYVVKHAYDTLSPWNSDTQKGSGSGLIIEGGLILTNAHVAADATFIEVQRHGETERHEAEVVNISHEADLALLRPKDKTIYKDVKPLELGDLPKMQQPIEVYGFPIGGNTLSVTRGVVSRIEKQDYVHTGENLLAAQVDAAINFGNSGGPVVSNGKVVGVAMQSGFLTENIGYMIPTPIIRHFLDDIKDKKVNGFGFPGFLVQSMENPSMRRKYNLTPEQTGVLVYKVYSDTPAAKDNLIREGDIITQVDGYSIQNNGTVEFRPGEYIDYTHYVDLHQLGEVVKFTLLRDAKPQEITLLLDRPGKDYLLVKPRQYDFQPTYVIYGGFVFMPLNHNILRALDPVPVGLSALSQEPPTKDRSEVVLMTKVLPADINKDYHQANNVVITKVNGKPIKNFREFYEQMEASNDEFIKLQADDGFQIVIERAEAKRKQPDILLRYGVNADRSKDLLSIKAPTSMADTKAVTSEAQVTPPEKTPDSKPKI
ncbi:S1C family serine protease [Thiofilum flexile]|uniref:S1C family serine protease n=1 Tax=Thiofilum flexile TaxID=125627 RepID=UPI000365C0A0|nr:S1C family serine protease [Thiofilum flexile]